MQDLFKQKTLCDELDTLSRYGAIKKNIPDYIVSNLNPKFILREYQIEATARFIYYLNDFPDKPPQVQLLFNLATGSGKTLLMAGNILYLYKMGYRNFIFFVNSVNIIEKTKDNFLNKTSSKYLFNQKIVIDSKEVKIKPVSNFEAVNNDDINILFTTIQGLHINMNNPRENTITFEDFNNKEIVLLSDEAHHINTLTKAINKNKIENGIELEFNSWEYTVSKIFAANIKNILLEYTATIDMDDQNILDKYSDKIIYKYDLKSFRNDGFSKEVDVIEADLEPIDRAISAIILSQYRRKIAEKNKIHLKPIVLFKSNFVNPPKNPDPEKIVSSEFKAQFHDKIKNLKTAYINRFKKINSRYLQEALKYFDENNIDIIKELQYDFSEEKCISVDTSSDSEAKQILVNTLEDESNEIRAIFAVDMLNEGWDVLNLFDIVRLYNTRDAKFGKAGKTTIAEAQLIGRGARYFPFRINTGDDIYKRKFDSELDNELRVLEHLHYHSAYNPKYIQELNQALVNLGIKPSNKKEIIIKVKKDFKESDFWNKGYIYINKQVPDDRKNKKVKNDIPDKTYYHTLMTGFSTELKLFDNQEKFTSDRTINYQYKIKDFDYHIIKKAIDKTPFYYFNNLIKFYPDLSSIREFIASDEHLASVPFEVTMSAEIRSKNDINNFQKLEILLDVLKQISNDLIVNKKDYIGTKEFIHKPVNEVVKDKILNIVLDDLSDKQSGRSMNENTIDDFSLI